MEFEKLFSVVVLSGAMLTSGCGKKEAGASSSVNAPAEATTAVQTVAPVDAKPTVPETELEIPPPAGLASKRTKEGERCDEICDGLTDDGEVICPIPDGEGGTNCCWLMIPKHECCPS